MKILLVSTQDYIHHPIPSRHHYIFEELAKTHEVHVPHFHVSDGKARPTRLHVHEATLVPVREPAFHYTLNAPYQYKVLKDIIRENDVDVVVAGHILAGASVIRAAKRLDIPVVFDLKDWLPDSAAAYYKNELLKKIIKGAVWRLTKYNLEQSDRITTVSPSLVDRLQSVGFESQLITNGVDTDAFRPLDSSEIREELDIDQDAFVIGFVGSIERWFSLDEIIRALPELLKERRDIIFLVVGGALFTDYLAELKVLVNQLGVQDNIRFTGIIEYPRLPRYIAAMDVCTIPFSSSIWDNIALPNKFFEYSACGKPILMTPIPDVLKIGGPNLFVYHSRKEFIEHLHHLMRTPQTYSIDLSRYSWKSKAREFESLFNEVVQTSRVPGR